VLFRSEGPVTVLYEGKPIDLGSTVAEAGLEPLARVDVRPAREGGAA